MQGSLRTIASVTAVALFAVVGCAAAVTPAPSPNGTSATPSPSPPPSSSPTSSPSMTVSPSPTPFRLGHCCVGWPEYLPGTRRYTPPGWVEVLDAMRSLVVGRSNGPAPGTVELYWRPALAAVDDGDCAGTAAPGVGNTVAEMVAAFGRDQRLVTTAPQPVVLAGYAGQTLDIQLKPGWGGTCDWSRGKPTAALLAGSETFFAITGSARVRAFLLDVGPDAYANRADPAWQEMPTVVVWIGIHSADGSNFDTLVTDAMPIVESFGFSSGTSGGP
jgi:hypothetical protein